MVNYHLRTLERHGLVELVEERRKGNMNERLMQATATSYVISPSALALVQPDPSRSPDRLSAFWLLALAARLVRDVGALITGGNLARKRVATFALDAEVRFATAPPTVPRSARSSPRPWPASPPSTTTGRPHAAVRTA